jgi:hypothetical protein
MAKCALDCRDKQGKPRFCPPGSPFTICPACRANMADASLNKSISECREIAHTYDVRKRRYELVANPTPGSYVATLQVKRKARAKLEKLRADKHRRKAPPGNGVHAAA